jgi:hypothetical protein
VTKSSSWEDGETKPAATAMKATRRSAPTESDPGSVPTADTQSTFRSSPISH